MSQTEDRNFNSFSLLRFVWKWRKTLLIICLAAAVLSLGVSFLIKPKYKSTAIVYAPRTNSVAKILLNEENYNERLDVKAYAVEEETEQMMQILNSREIKDALIEKFNLPVHYAIDTNAAHWKTKLYKRLTGEMTIKRTQYGAIEISVLDVDPLFASEMANEITNQLDTLKNRIEYERTAAAYKILQEEMDIMNAEVARIDDSIKMIMEHGVYDFESQSERVMQQYAIAVAQGNTAAMNRLQAELEKLSVWGPRSAALREVQFEFREYQALYKAKMMNARVDMSNEMPVKFVIEKAIPADKKAYPKKSLIVILSTLGAFVLGLFVLLTIEKVQAAPLSESEDKQ